VTDTEDLATGERPELPTGRAKPADKIAIPAWLETLLLLVTALVIALVIKTFFVQAFYIPSGSMRQTLQVSDRILVEKMSYWFGDVKRGDIVVFDDPAHWLQEEDGHTADNAFTEIMGAVGLYPTGGHLVKRVIGVGGDRVACQRGRVSVNGQVLHERSYVTLAPKACTGSWAYDVPPNHLWVLGDNREHSADSRAHVGDPGGGFIPVDDVVGKVFVVVWPSSRWQIEHRPSTFDAVALGAGDAALPGSVGAVGALALWWPLTGRLRRRTSW
jgi:signal peptidase I